MSQIILVTGPARSGKSEWAETLATETQLHVVYVATGNQDVNDTEWQKRIQNHQLRRPPNWLTLEVPRNLSHVIADAHPHSCILVDSLGTWVANYLDMNEETWSNIAKELLETVGIIAAKIIFVAEETGWGVIPAYPLGRIFRDRLGNLVRQLSVISDTTYLVTGGYVLNLRRLGFPLPVVQEDTN
ncbi:Adenosylcobinamide-phosphate guanylyltransferase [Richelia intracellularis HM01]|uniref:bifunctional adenosylcobinamide kinase/adenosylcobinamide-phosphate guanylyltransferase n=1 Tax=Richelia intracellularis TaxID=1164990 RepID=UPI0002B5A770|nr:bifunctional adenosylcobinamide kinase/adenosylcobinamide-phosphate guanylyltransferase [Richelia intracellularis]CCH65276.1 Adenosylcobinamide-phosphate guanylyltransferase [Richelia intracellularis HM01]